MNKWTKKFPNKEGLYWFYGYRYGKIIGGDEQDKEFILVELREISNGSMLIGNGQIIYKNELEEALFCKAEYPEIPNYGEIYDKRKNT